MSDLDEAMKRRGLAEMIGKDVLAALKARIEGVIQECRRSGQQDVALWPTFFRIRRAMGALGSKLSGNHFRAVLCCFEEVGEVTMRAMDSQRPLLHILNVETRAWGEQGMNRRPAVHGPFSRSTESRTSQGGSYGGYTSSAWDW